MVAARPASPATGRGHRHGGAAEILEHEACRPGAAAEIDDRRCTARREMAGKQLGNAAGAGDLEATEDVRVIILGPLPIEASRFAARAERSGARKSRLSLLLVVLIAGHPPKCIESRRGRGRSDDSSHDHGDAVVRPDRARVYCGTVQDVPGRWRKWTVTLCIRLCHPGAALPQSCPCRSAASFTPAAVGHLLWCARHQLAADERGRVATSGLRIAKCCRGGHGLMFQQPGVSRPAAGGRRLRRRRRPCRRH